MSTTTTNLGLTKPANNENVDISVINDNYDIIDTFAGSVPASSDIPSALSELTDDVTISSATDGQILTYDGTASKWKNAAAPSSGSTVVWDQKVSTGTNIADITINGVPIAVYAPSGGGGSSALSDLTDVTITNPSEAQIIAYSESAAKWVNTNSMSGSDIVNVKRKDNDYTTLTSVVSTIDVYWTDVSSEQNAYEFHCVKLYYLTGDKWYLKAIAPCMYNGTHYDTGDVIQSWADTDDVNFDVIQVPCPYTDITGTLTAGSTSITLSDASITTSSTIEVFDELDVPYISKTVSTGSVTVVFDAQASNMIVKVRVS